MLGLGEANTNTNTQVEVSVLCYMKRIIVHTSKVDYRLQYLQYTYLVLPTSTTLGIIMSNNTIISHVVYRMIYIPFIEQ